MGIVIVPGCAPVGYVVQTWLCLRCDETFAAEEPHDAHPSRWRDWWPLSSIRRDLVQ